MKQNHNSAPPIQPAATVAVADQLKRALRHLCLLAAMGLLATSAAQAASTAWNGGGGADLNWSTSANWSNGVPTATTDVFFVTNAASASASTPNNIVDANRIIQSLSYQNTNASTYQTTLINPGVTLTISNAVNNAYVLLGGGAYAPILNLTSYIQGSGGNLAIIASNGIMSARQSMTGTSGGPRYTLDMSDLGNFTGYLGRLYVAGDAGNRSSGTMCLPRTNLILLGYSSGPPLLLGNHATGGTSGVLNLGMTNAIFCDLGMWIGYSRSSSSLMTFNPPTATGGFAYFRNRAGTGPQSYWHIGDGSNVTYSGNSANGTADFSLGTVDAMVSELVVGRNQNTAGAPSLEAAGASGTLNINSGNLSVNTAIIGYQMVDNGPAAKGTVNVTGTAQLTVTNSILLGRFMAAITTNGNSFAVLNISQGAVTVTGNITTTTNANNTGSYSEIHVVNQGSLSVKGKVGPLTTFDLGNGTLTLDLGGSPNPASAVCTTVNLQTSYPVDVNLLGATALSVGQFPLIKYQNLLAGDPGTDLRTLSLPPYLEGYLSNNTANSSIDLVITNTLVTVWNGDIDGNWDIGTTANWKDSTTGTSKTYGQSTLPGDNVRFDDTATGTTTVTLMTNTLAPLHVTVTNDSKAYTFTGSGRLTGAAGLAKTGSGTLTIGNSGVNDFAGGIAIGGGTVQISGSADRLPTNAAVTLADASGTVLDLNNLNQTLAVISGGGTSGGNISLGSGTLTVTAGSTYGGVISGSGKLVKTSSGSLILSGANLFGGGTLITTNSSVTLANSSGSGLGSGNIEVGSGGTLRIGNAGANGSVGSVAITNNGTVIFNRTDDITFANLITATGQVSKLQANIVTLPAANDFTGLTSISAGALRVTHPNALGTALTPGSDWSTTLGNAQSVRLELANDVTLAETLQLPQKSGTFARDPEILAVSGTNTLTGLITLTTGGTAYNFKALAGSKLVLNSLFSASTSWASGFPFYVLDGDGDGEILNGLPNGANFNNITNSLYKQGLGTWTLRGQNMYKGFTVISNGTLIVNGSVLGTNTFPMPAGFFIGFNIRAAGTLMGNGLIQCAVTNAGTLSPGTSIGTLTISNNLTLLAGSINVFEVSASSYDQVRGLSSVFFGGKLQVSLVGTLNGGEVFKLFDAPPAGYNGVFDEVSLPTLPAALAWDTNQLTSAGILRVTGGNIHIGSPALAADGNFVMGGTSAAAGQGYRVLATTNVADPLSWIQVGVGTFGAGDGSFAFTDLGSTNFPQRFYRVVTP